MNNSYDWGQHDPSVTNPNSGSGGSTSGITYDSHGNPIGIQTGPSTGGSGGFGNGGGGSGGGLPWFGGGSSTPAGYTSVAQGGGLITGTGAAATTGTGAASYLGMTVPQWISTALSLYGAYRGSQPGRFQQIPEDPTQTAARAKLLGYVDNSPTRDMLGNLIAQRLGSAHGFQLPPGANGYNPSPGGGAPAYDLSKILPTLMGNAKPTMQAPPSDMAGQWLSEHPEVVQLGADVAAGAIAQQFGLSQEQALQIVAGYLRSQRQPMQSGSGAGLGLGGIAP